MKKRIPTFLAGMLTTAIIGSLAVGALAATGKLTIEVNPINVQVNGQTFQPKDAKGNDVPVFAYNGTTYAPLRALAEAYGLEVGYDAAKNMATVGEKGSTTTPPTPTTPDKPTGDYSDWTAEEEKAYQEFKGMWTEIDTKELEKYGIVGVHHIENTDGTTQLGSWLKATGEPLVQRISTRFSNSVYDEYFDPNKPSKLIHDTISYYLDLNDKLIILWSDDRLPQQISMETGYSETSVMRTLQNNQ